MDRQEYLQSWYRLKWLDSWKQLWEKCRIGFGRERERSDEAVKEAQALRRQLDVHEMRAVLASRPLGSEGALVPPPGLADVVEPSPGVYTGVTSNHPPSVPALTGHPEARATVRPEDDYVQDRSYQGRAGAPSGVSQGVE